MLKLSNLMPNFQANSRNRFNNFVNIQFCDVHFQYDIGGQLYPRRLLSFTRTSSISTKKRSMLKNLTSKGRFWPPMKTW